MQQGLLQQPQPEQAPQQPQPKQNYSDEQLQEQYGEAYEYVEQLAAHPQAVDRLADMIASGETVQAGLAEAAAFILVRTEAHMELADAVKGELIGDVLEVVFEMAGEMGIVDEQDITEQMIQEVVQIGTERYAEMKEDAGLPVDAESSQRDLQELEQEGAIDELKREMPEDAEAIDQMLAMTRGGM